RAADQAGAREARRIVEEGIQAGSADVAEGTAAAAGRADGGGAAGAREAAGVAARADGTSGAVGRNSAGRGIEAGSRVRVRGMTGEVLEVRSDGKLSVVVGAVRMVVSAGEATPVAGERPRRPHLSSAAADPAAG